MGITDEAGKTVSGIVEALKSSPLVLSLVLMNLGLIGLLYVIAGKSAETRQREFTAIFQNQEKMLEVVAKCGTDKPEVRQ